MTKNFQHRPTAWLWWMALFILLIGSALTFMFSQDLINPEAKNRMATALMFTVAGTGFCVICATAGFWMKR